MRVRYVYKIVQRDGHRRVSALWNALPPSFRWEYPVNQWTANDARLIAFADQNEAWACFHRLKACVELWRCMAIDVVDMPFVLDITNYPVSAYSLWRFWEGKHYQVRRGMCYRTAALDSTVGCRKLKLVERLA